MPAPIERRTMRKVYIRLLPFAFTLYLICYLDRANIGFAALTMNRDLGFSSYVYGLGAGAFFWGYFLLEVPSNLILERVGARRWIARIMITWGIVSGCFAFVQGPITFFTLRFLLGLAEAGFVPGMILYFTYWFPPYHRARVIAGFMAAIPASIGLGAPVSTALLGLDGTFGLAGWKWLFLAEAAPAVLLGIAVLFYLTDRPAVANWLEPDERQWLGAVMAEEKRLVDAEHRVSVWQSLIDRRVLTLGFIHFAQAGVSVSIAVFVAQMIKQLGLTNMQTGWVTAIPFVCGTIGILIWGQLSDRMNERRWNLAGACLCMAAGLAAAGALQGSFWSIAGLSLAMVGLYAGNAHLFPIPSMFLTGAAAASGIAWVNSLGISLAASRLRRSVGSGIQPAALRAACISLLHLVCWAPLSQPSPCAKQRRNWRRVPFRFSKLQRNERRVRLGRDPAHALPPPVCGEDTRPKAGRSRPKRQWLAGVSNYKFFRRCTLDASGCSRASPLPPRASMPSD